VTTTTNDRLPRGTKRALPVRSEPFRERSWTVKARGALTLSAPLASDAPPAKAARPRPTAAPTTASFGLSDIVFKDDTPMSVLLQRAEGRRQLS
jgi:hypothetical protein